MFSEALRTRLEGQAEALEADLQFHAQALRSARRGDLQPALRLVLAAPRFTPPPWRSDPEVKAAIARWTDMRAKVRALGDGYLSRLGVDVRDAVAVRAACSVRYEHHHLTPAFLVRAVQLFAFMVALPVLMWRTVGLEVPAGALGLAGLVFVARRWGTSHVVLTDRWLSAEGTTVSLVGVTHAELWTRRWGELPFRAELRLLGPDVDRRLALHHCSRSLRRALARCAVPVRRRYSWFEW